MSEAEHRAQDEHRPGRIPKGVLTIAVLGLVFITGGAVGGIVAAVLFQSASTDSLSTIAAVGVGALAGILGTKAQTHKEE